MLDYEIEQESNNLTYVIIEYATGGDIGDVLELVKHFDEPGGRFFMEQMCDVMGFVHA